MSTQAKQALALSIDLLPGAESPLPTEFRLFRAGANRTTKGVLLFSDRSATSVLSTFADRGTDLAIDYEHASLNADVSPNPSEAGKAAGWFRPEIRGGELWAVGVTWTPAAAEKLRAREYRYTSPVVMHEADGTITDLLGCALTNMPATKDLSPLVAHSEPAKEHRMKTVLSALALAETATEAEALEKLNAIQASAETAKKLEGDLSALTGSLLSLTGKATVSEAMGQLAANKQAAEQTAALTERVQSLEAEKRDAEVEGIVKALRDEGKLSAAMEPWARETGKKDLATLKAFAASAPKIIPLGEQQREPKPAAAKKWSEMSYSEKAELFHTDKALYDQLKAEAEQK